MAAQPAPPGPSVGRCERLGDAVALLGRALDEHDVAASSITVSHYLAASDRATRVQVTVTAHGATAEQAQAVLTWLDPAPVWLIREAGCTSARVRRLVVPVGALAVANVTISHGAAWPIGEPA